MYNIPLSRRRLRFS